MGCDQSAMSQSKMTRTFILLCIATVVSIARSYQIHDHMTAQERMSIFNTGKSSVPPYEVVSVLHTPQSDRRDNARSVQVYLKAFGKHYNLSLKPTKGLFRSDNHVPMWTVAKSNSEPNGLDYEEVEEASVDIGDLYQDAGNMASILLHQDGSGKVVVDGNIGSELVIRPLPERLLTKVVENGEGFDQSIMWPNVTKKINDTLKQTNHHVVFRTLRMPTDDKYSDFMLMEPDHLSKRFRSKRSVGTRSKREAPYVIYPEILCIVDYDGYRLHGGDNVQIKRYFVSFWNGVDLRYKLLKGPKIRISIAGIIISRGRDATPYLERNRVGRDAIDSAAALTDMGKYLFRERRLPVYDIAVAVTKLDMCRRQYASDSCNRGTAGFAYVGGACVVNKRLEKVNSVAIIEDTGGFSGIIVAAHEVGHLLGAVHDGSPPPSYLGGPGAEKCRWEDGYIMSDLRHTENGFKWSHCSVSSFHHFLNGDTATCLYNTPHEDEALPRVLPGKLLSLDAQCRKDRGTSACFKDDRVCAQLFCFDAGSGYCVAYRPAAEGSPCGNEQYCLGGKCVAEHENIIPDYTQNIPTYVQRDSIYSPATQNGLSIGQYNSTAYRSSWDVTKQTTPQTGYNKYSDIFSHYPSYTRATTMHRNAYVYSTHVPAVPAKTTNYNAIDDNDKTSSTRYGASSGGTTIANKSNNNNNKNNNNDYDNKNNVSLNEYGTSSSTASPIISSKLYGNRNNALHSKMTSLKYKLTPTTASFAFSVNGDDQQSTTGHETEDGECTDVATDCAELIDRLETWLCHLRSVRNRCCASLKGICNG